MKTLFTFFLIIHIAGGTTSLIAGFIAMLAFKGSSVHRKAGKFFFWGMTTACTAAVYLSIANPNPFLLTHPADTNLILVWLINVHVADLFS